MRRYAQYDENGAIAAVVISDRAPAHPRQKEIAEGDRTEGKKIDMLTGDFVDVPLREIPPDSLEAFAAAWPPARIVKALGDTAALASLRKAAKAVRAEDLGEESP